MLEHVIFNFRYVVQNQTTHHACKRIVLHQKSAQQSALRKWISLKIHGIGKISRFPMATLAIPHGLEV